MFTMAAILFWTLIAFVVQSSDAIKCSRCDLASYIEECTSTLECAPDEICYMESMLQNLTITFNAGCSPKTVCDFTGSDGGKRQTGLIVCFKCCEGNDSCNNDLCGITSDPSANLTTDSPLVTNTTLQNIMTTLLTVTSTEMTTMPSPVSTTVSGNYSIRCKRCDLASYIEECTTTIPCAAGEICYTESLLMNHTVKFNAGCSPKTVCNFAGSIVGKRQTDLIGCWQCCDGNDSCNTDLCGIESNPFANLTTDNPVVTSSTVQTTRTSPTIVTSTDITTMHNPLSTTVTGAYGIKCKQCNLTSYIDECTTTIQCAHNEICYTESILVNHTVKFNAGCSSRSVCNFAGSTGNKRQTDLIGCWKCCEGNDSCNAELCGIESNPLANLTTDSPVVTSTPFQTTRTSSTIVTRTDITTMQTTISATVTGTYGIKCKQCNLASYIEECTTSIHCAPDEICYTEAILVNLTIKYNAGCSSRSVCGLAGSVSGKRQTDLIGCWQCCEGNESCNADLCGIESNPLANLTTDSPVVTNTTVQTTMTSVSTTETGTLTTQFHGTRCHSCNDMHNGRVNNSKACNKMATCHPDEMCSVEDFMEDSERTYSFGCQNNNICRLLTKLAIEDMYRCKDPQIQAAGFCSRKRESEKSTCNVCCGDELCNRDSCEHTLDELYVMWENNLLDMYTLKKKGSGSSSTIAG